VQGIKFQEQNSNKKEQKKKLPENPFFHSALKKIKRPLANRLQISFIA